MRRSDGRRADRRRGIGIFGCVTWGWTVTLVLLVVVAATVAVGWWLNDPGRNPPPAEYATTACRAFARLEEGALSLRSAVDAAGDGEPGAAAEAAGAERAALSASDIAAGLPEWGPGEPFNELLASLIVATLNGADALADDDLDAARDELALAEDLVADGRRALDEERFGFGCA